ncbi:hypothetical protein V0M98_33305 (plasmid) [Pseudomonas silesiensis]|uniref:hypothetical protein n=1 Tax=Pseudomonas silesiensis TaxID=1853130 RepID=UPI0030D3A4D9
MDKILPEQAYEALKGLKAQVAAVNDQIEKRHQCRKALSEAHQVMEENEPWTSAIVRKLMINKEGLTIEAVDDAWLEKVFA